MCMCMYVLSACAGICFVGIVIIKPGIEMMLNKLF